MYSKVEIIEVVEYLRAVSENTSKQKPNKKVNLDWDLYLELFFGKISKKLHMIAIIGMNIGL